MGSALINSGDFMKILGAGLAGLLAGVLNQNAFILEPFERRKSHQALLRFRAPDIGEAVGIPFKKVQVYKGIWDDGPVSLTPQYISQYARKVSRKIAYRSICNVEQETRWIAPMDFQERLEEMCWSRIDYNCNIEELPILPDQIISTIPIHVLAKILGVKIPVGDLAGEATKSIFVSKYKIPDCDVYMTNYFPALNTPIYRASISEDVLIIESIRELGRMDLEMAIRSLGVNVTAVRSELLNYEQKNGKISPINEAWRKDFILNATLEHNIYSLGRFATWRNIVLDDVYHDILRIKQFINRDKYDHHKDY